MIPLLLALGCTPYQSVPTRPENHSRSAWDRTWRDWTEELRLYDQYSTALYVRATWVGPELRDAMVDEIVSREALDAATAADLSAAMTEAGQSGHEVVFGAQKMADIPRDFGLSPDSPWHLSLAVAGRPCPGLSITKVDTAASPRDATLFLQTTPWTELWRARFDPSCGRSGEAVLTIGGAYGSGALRWTLDG